MTYLNLQLEMLPEGLVLPDGQVLTYEPHRECACADCSAAFEAFDAGLLESDIGEDL